jgi:DNA invertase Pin-like site-specific DNA recombinase
MIAAIYARRSSSQAGRDEQDLSVTRQIDLARRFAESKGWIVADEHVYADDGVSGAEVASKLREKQRMLSLIESGAAPFQAIVMQSNDRLSRRDGDEALGELKAISSAGIQVWFYADGSRFEYGTFAANTLAFLRGEFAAEYRRSVAQKTAEALRRKAERGHVVGAKVFGYLNHRVNSHVERRIVDEQAAVIRRIFEMYASGDGLKGIAHALNDDHAPCPRPILDRVSEFGADGVETAAVSWRVHLRTREEARSARTRSAARTAAVELANGAGP